MRNIAAKLVGIGLRIGRRFGHGDHACGVGAI